MAGERLQKLLARAGVASRRHSEDLIRAGRVAVNGRTVVALGTKVDPERDEVTLDGRPLGVAPEHAYALLYKPPGVVTTLSDPRGRATVATLACKLEGSAGRRLFPVGRLDYDAEGALLLTDDGELANRLLHPRYGVSRTYLAKVKGAPDAATLERLRAGVRLEDGLVVPRVVEVFAQAQKNTWIKLVLAEGRRHVVKRLCAAVGHPVMRLFRPLQAGVSVRGMHPGQVRWLTEAEVATVRAVASGQEPDELELWLPPRAQSEADDATSL